MSKLAYKQLVFCTSNTKDQPKKRNHYSSSSATVVLLYCRLTSARVQNASIESVAVIAASIYLCFSGSDRVAVVLLSVHQAVSSADTRRVPWYDDKNSTDKG